MKPLGTAPDKIVADVSQLGNTATTLASTTEGKAISMLGDGTSNEMLMKAIEEIEDLEFAANLLVNEGRQGKIEKIEQRMGMDIQTSIEQGLLLLADMIRQLQEKGYETKSIETRAETVRSKLYQGMDETGMFHMDGPIPFANHWDPYFKIERTVFGKNELGLQRVYSDRLMDQNLDKYYASREIADRLFPEGVTKTFRWAQALLEAYYGKSVELRLVRASVNHGNGHDLHYYGWKFTDESTKTQI